MPKKNAIIATICAACMLGTLVILYAMSPLTKELYRGGFERKFITNEFLLPITKGTKLPNDSYYISGASKENVYFADYSDPFHLIQINTESLDSQHIRLKLRTSELYAKEEYKIFRIKVDSPYFYIMNGTRPRIFRGRLDNPIAERVKNDSSFFADAEPISTNSFAVRYHSKKNKSMEIGKESGSFSGIKYNYDIIEKQADGIFCTQGTLMSNKEGNELVYMYMNRNEYVVLDTNLVIKYKSTTLDTFHTAVVKYSKIDNETMMATGIPTVVNPFASASKSLLLVKSNILSKSEDLQTFIDDSILDIFDLKTKKYRGSISIHKIGKGPVTGLRLTPEKLIMQYGENIMIHSLAPDSLLKNSNR
jgi:hypothetical protein